MKIRNGFVSNSSSSSFVVATKDPEKTKITISFEVDIERYADKKIKNKKQLDEYFLEWKFWYDSETIEDALKDPEESENIKEQYKKSLELINEGKTILVGNFTNENYDPVEGFLCEKGLPRDSEDIIIIDNDPGF